MLYRQRYSDSAKQNAYMNAVDCLYFGYGISYWNDCGCEDRMEVWEQAKEDMANGL